MNLRIGMTTIALLTVIAGVRPAAANGEFIWPNNARITSTNVYPNGSRHSGSADLAAPSWTHIGAARAGTAYPFRDSYGANCVKITHGSGYYTIYAHMVKWPSVYSGEKVSRNHLIGYVGSTGNSTGPHCHFAIMRYSTRLVIPNIWIGKYVSRGNVVPGSYAGLSGSTGGGGSTAPSVLFKARVTAGALNVRTGAGTSYGIVGVLTRGTIVSVYAKSGSWYKISYGGNYRWIAGWYTVRI